MVPWYQDSGTDRYVLRHPERIHVSLDFCSLIPRPQDTYLVPASSNPKTAYLGTAICRQIGNFMYLSLSLSVSPSVSPSLSLSFSSLPHQPGRDLFLGSPPRRQIPTPPGAPSHILIVTIFFLIPPRGIKKNSRGHSPTCIRTYIHTNEGD